MNVVILGLGQHMDFGTRAAINVLSVGLPNGAIIQVPVEDDVAKAILGALIGEPPEAPKEKAAVAVRQPQTAHEVFETEENDEGDAFIMGPEPIASVRVQAPPPRTPAVRKSRVTGKDNAGNPIVEFLGNDVAHISDVVGTVGVMDEDGVSQL